MSRWYARGYNFGLTILFALAFALGLALGRLSVPANAQEVTPVEKKIYRVVGTQSDKKLEQEINELAEYGCKPLFGVGSGYSEANVILECPEGTPSLHR